MQNLTKLSCEGAMSRSKSTSLFGLGQIVSQSFAERGFRGPIPVVQKPSQPKGDGIERGGCL